MQQEVDLEGDGSGYSGTFRWKSSKRLGSLPTTTNNRKMIKFTDWMSYLSSRESADLTQTTRQMIQNIQSDLSCIDCLSTPLSICYLFENSVFKVLRHDSKNYKRITLVCMGCSSKAEERVLRETNCFLELCYYFHNVQHIELWLVGPEMSATVVQLQTHKNIVKNQQLTCSIFKGTSIDFFRAHPHCFASKHTVVIGFNCGFGNYENDTPTRFNLLLSWLPDLYFLSGTNLPVLFTCANDYADLNGEVTIMHKILGANFILLPRENPFSYASTMVPPARSAACRASAEGEHDEYSRGNSFCYGIQGCSKERRHKVEYAKGAQCLPQFLGLFNAPVTVQLSALLVDCTLQLEAFSSGKHIKPAMTSTDSKKERITSSPDENPDDVTAVVAVEPVADMSASESGEAPAHRGAATREDLDMAVVIARVEQITVMESTKTVHSESVNVLPVWQPEQKPPSAVPNSAAIASTKESATAPAVPMMPEPAPVPTAVFPPAPSVLTTSEFTLTQAVSVDGSQLVMTVFFLGDAAISMAEVELSLSEDGTLLLLTLPVPTVPVPVPLVNKVSETSPGTAGKTHRILLCAAVLSDSMLAKYTKKRRVLTVTADVKAVR